MTAKLDHRGWTAAEHIAPCVILRPARNLAITTRQALPLDMRHGMDQATQPRRRATSNARIRRQTRTKANITRTLPDLLRQGHTGAAAPDPASMASAALSFHHLPSYADAAGVPRAPPSLAATARIHDFRLTGIPTWAGAA